MHFLGFAAPHAPSLKLAIEHRAQSNLLRSDPKDILPPYTLARKGFSMRRSLVGGTNYPRMLSRLARLTSQQGFTIFDLLTVMAIIAVLAAMALPTMTQEMAKYRLNGAARQLAGELMAARMRAVAQNRDVKVSFLDDAVKICDGDCEGSSKTINIRDSYKDITIESNKVITFNHRGAASTFGTINVSNSKGKRSITVAITGRVKIGQVEL